MTHSLPVMPGVIDRVRPGMRVLLAGLWVSLSLIHWPIPLIGGPAGLVPLVAVLFLSLLLAPLEYALGALSFSFVAASSDRLSPAFRSLRWAFLGAAIVILAVRFFLRRRAGRRPGLNRFDYLLVAFSAVASAAIVQSFSVRLSLLKLLGQLGWFYVSSLGLQQLVQIYGPAAPRRFICGQWSYLVAVVAFPMAGFLFRLGPPAERLGWFTGYLGNPNSWAILTITVLPWLAAPLVRPQRWGARQWAWGLAVLVVAYSLLRSGSRAGILAAAIAASVICMIHANRRIAAVVALGTVLFGIRSLSEPEFISDLVRRYVVKHANKGPLLLQSRAAPWKAVRKQFERHPWLGMGFGVTSETQSSWAGAVGSEGMLETGSSFWGTLSQVGIVGSAVVFLAIAGLLAQGARFAWQVRDPWFTAVYSSVVALTANAAFEGWLLAPGSFANACFWLECFLLNALMCRFRPTGLEAVSLPVPHTADAGAV